MKGATTECHQNGARDKEFPSHGLIRDEVVMLTTVMQMKNGVQQNKTEKKCYWVAKQTNDTIVNIPGSN